MSHSEPATHMDQLIIILARIMNVQERLLAIVEEDRKEKEGELPDPSSRG